MTEISLAVVPFHGDNLVVVRGTNPSNTMVAAKPLVENIGMDWATQFRKLKQHPVLSKAIVNLTIPWGGNQQEMVAIPLVFVPFWMATIQPNKVPDLEIRARIIRYQLECANVLFQHFFGAILDTKPSKSRPVSGEPYGMRLALVRQAKQVFGNSAAARLWIDLELPDNAEMYRVQRQRTLRFKPDPILDVINQDELDEAGPEKPVEVN